MAELHTRKEKQNLFFSFVYWNVRNLLDIADNNRPQHHPVLIEYIEVNIDNVAIIEARFPM